MSMYGLFIIFHTNDFHFLGKFQFCLHQSMFHEGYNHSEDPSAPPEASGYKAVDEKKIRYVLLGEIPTTPKKLLSSFKSLKQKKTFNASKCVNRTN